MSADENQETAPGPQRAALMAFASKRTTGGGSVSDAFQLGAELGVGPLRRIRNAALISITPEERRARPPMARE